MKKNISFILLTLIIIAYFVVDNRLNKDYKDFKTITTKNNELIILKRGDYYGVLELKNQTISPQKANYKWILTKNKVIKLADKSSCAYGSGITGDDVSKGKLTPIEFGSFRFYWSPNTDSVGFVYLNYYPKFNEQNGPLYWTISKDKNINDSTLIKAETKFQLLSVKKRNIVSWLFRKD